MIASNTQCSLRSANVNRAAVQETSDRGWQDVHEYESSNPTQHERISHRLLEVIVLLAHHSSWLCQSPWLRGCSLQQRVATFLSELLGSLSAFHAHRKVSHCMRIAA